jgi:hypothetical protein
MTLYDGIGNPFKVPWSFAHFVCRKKKKLRLYKNITGFAVFRLSAAAGSLTSLYIIFVLSLFSHFLKFQLGIGKWNPPSHRCQAIILHFLSCHYAVVNQSSKSHQGEVS